MPAESAYGRAAPSKKAPLKGKANVPAKEIIDAPPESSSDEDSAANIKPTIFKPRSKSPTPDVKGAKSAAGGNKKKATANGMGIQASRSTKAGVWPGSSRGSSTTKRKSQPQEDNWLGKGMVDVFGRVNTKPKKARTIYEHSQSRVASSRAAPSSRKAAGSPQASCQGFQIPDLLESPISSRNTQDSPAKSVFWKPDEIEESPVKSNPPTEKFTAPPEFENSPMSTPGVNKGFKIPSQVETPSVSDSKGGESFTDPGKLEDTPTSTPPCMKKLFQMPKNAIPFKRDPNTLLELGDYDLGVDLATRVQGIIGLDSKELGADSGGLFDDFDTSITVEARCPMCNQPCDATELKKWGTMNTRQQERFCRSHRRHTAEKKWSSKGYPEIDWEKLDSRISEHHDFVKAILNGADCHYRKTFEEMVAAGKGRSLRKMDANLTPGYYGSRGLNTISEHVIREFSGLLSKRSVKDRLISKRGTTAFVQSVIVPEVAVQLIMEDMSVNHVEARDVLTESSDIGELVHEEIRDVVVEMVENSEDNDD